MCVHLLPDLDPGQEPTVQEGLDAADGPNIVLVFAPVDEGEGETDTTEDGIYTGYNRTHRL